MNCAPFNCFSAEIDQIETAAPLHRNIGEVIALKYWSYSECDK
jgi:hypothetical protein